MAIYKIFPEKDTTIYSAYPTTNAGLDSILEISNSKPLLQDDNEISRILIQFPAVTNTGNYKAFLKLYLANAESLPDNYIIYANPVSQSWEEGIGRYLYNPSIKEGCTWQHRSTELDWPSSSYASNTTGSFRSDNPGGASWYTLRQGSQSFSPSDSKDIEIDVTSIVSGSTENNGIILRIESGYEFNESSSFSLKYFAKDTHTIYPPQLEIRWDDSSYVTGSLTLISSGEPVAILGNNKGAYNQNDICKFKVNARDQYPVRQFVTSSVYTTNKALPSSSYWALKDFDTGEYVIDFDTNYTKLSCDSTSNYFSLNMNGLQPERYYEIVIKSSLDDGSVKTFKGNYIFKINK